MMSWLFYSLCALFIGYLLDLLLGDPQGFPHIIRGVGLVISALEKALRRLLPKTQGGELFGGVLLVVFVLIICAVLPAALLVFLYSLNVYAGLALESLICYQMLATRALRDESMAVYRQLEKEDLAAARKAVSMIVGRDTQGLEREGITRATVETIAENTSDGVLAPLFYMMLGGAPLGLFYKAVNTMDSMVGYKNDRYLFFGRAAAKFDDVLNFLPARLSAAVMIAVSFLLGYNARDALRIYRRDRFNHKSPNSAHTESVCAGALQIRLGGGAYYFGKFVDKPTIGDDIRPILVKDIKNANRLMTAASLLTLTLSAAVKAVVIILI
jgi:adenosylcobinamide-phosphate synthase